MKLEQIIAELRREKAVIDRRIASLEALNGIQPGQEYPGKRRGRKNMGAAERKEVSARMKRYWANQRRQRESAQ